MNLTFDAYNVKPNIEFSGLTAGTTGWLKIKKLII
jgi:hypothetical protein